MHIVLIHGYNDPTAGERNVDRLAPYLRAAGHTVDTDTADYGWFSLFMVRFHKYSAVRRIRAALWEADAVISHSNGSNYENKALRSLHGHTRNYRVVRLSPALNRSTGVADNVDLGFVFHTKADIAVWFAALLPWHPWGSQGRKGYRGKDSRIINWDFSDTVSGHSDWFDDDNIESVARDVLSALEAP